MTVGILGKKLGMTQVFNNTGQLVPVTVIQAGPCPVIQVKSKDKDGYSAIQIGFDRSGKKRSASKPLSGHFKKANVDTQKILKEIPVPEDSTFKMGDILTVDQFKPADIVNVTGITKGRGFTGVMKRHGFAGKDTGHGSHEAYRHGGSIGCRTPKHTIKGMRMAGRMGTDRVTLRNLKIIMVDPENNLLLIKGSLPGWRGGYLLVKKS
ncbi:50S ribosomal protein L3 [bacterium]|nr:50S ribosomal protein L3 [candidate division CSSED10-310 bacterium]